MKIGIICYPTLGGSGVVATELGHVLAAQGHTVHFIAYEIPFRLQINDHNIFFHQVEINRYDLFKYPDYALPLSVKIASVSKEYDLDILHVHYAIPHATSACLAKLILGKTKPVVITTLHGTDITLVGRDPAYYQIVKYSIEHSDGVTAVSENLRKQTIEYFQINKPIEVIHNFFIPQKDLIGKKPLRDQFVHNDEKLLVHCSNFRSVKRPEDVVRIFWEVRKQLRCKLLFLGAGAGIERVRQLIHDYKIEPEVFFLGDNKEVDPFIASADLLLLPSSQESFGLVALEAMAYGVPVIASNVGGIPEVVEHGKTGLLADPCDVTQMAKHVISLFNDTERLKKMQCQAIERARKKFCVSKIFPQYISYYQKVTGL